MKTIPLWAKDGSICAEAIVDDQDYDWLSRSRWWMDKDGYATRSARTGHRTTTYRMNREILGLEKGDGKIGDHINRDRRDNRRANLRVVDCLGNSQNRSLDKRNTTGFRGVYRVKATGKFIARVRLGTPGRLHNLGTYPTAEEAAQVALRFRVENMPWTMETVE